MSKLNMCIAKNICVVIPMHNEEQVVEEVIQNLRHSFDNILVVDDGSTDGSSQILSRLDVNVLTHCINLGQGAAITTAFQYLEEYRSPDIVGLVTCDADGQHSTQDIISLAEELLNCEEDIILGSRFLGHKKNIPFIRRWVLNLAARLTKFVTGVNLTDTHNGLKAIKMSAVLKFNIRTHGYAFETELITEIANHRLKYKEMPTNIVYTKYSMQKGQTLRNGLVILEDLVTLVTRS